MNKFIVLLLLFAATTAEAQTSALAVADSLYAVGNYSEAIKLLEKSETKSEAVLLKLAQAQKANGNLNAALHNYQGVLESNPNRVLTTVEYGKLLSSTGKLEMADSIFTHLMKKYPINAEFHYQLGLIREKRKDSTAMKHYNLAVLINRTHQQALIKVSKNALVKGKVSRAERLAKQGLEVNPANIALLSILAQAYYYQKEYKQAIVEFEKLVDLGHGSEFVHTKIGTAYFHLENYEKAIANFNSALNYEEENHATHYSLGKLYALMGEYKNSEGHLLQAILLKDVILDEEFTSLGLTYKYSDEPKKAMEYFNKALAENPDNERAMFERAVVADSYFKDLETRMNYFQAYLKRFGETGSPNLLLLAQYRVKDLREEIHMNPAAK